MTTELSSDTYYGEYFSDNFKKTYETCATKSESDTDEKDYVTSTM